MKENGGPAAKSRILKTLLLLFYNLILILGRFCMCVLILLRFIEILGMVGQFSSNVENCQPLFPQLCLLLSFWNSKIQVWTTLLNTVSQPPEALLMLLFHLKAYCSGITRQLNHTQRKQIQDIGKNFTITKCVHYPINYDYFLGYFLEFKIYKIQ